MFLAAGSTRDVRFTLMDNTGVYWTDTAIGTVIGDRLSIVPSGTFSYNATDFTDAGTDGFDMLEIAIDIGGVAGVIDGGDYKRALPVAFDTGDLGTINYNIDAWDLRPVFDDEGAY